MQARSAQNEDMKLTICDASHVLIVRLALNRYNVNWTKI